MKFFGKKVVSIALAALLVVSAFVTFPLTASATAGDFGFYVKSSQTNSKIYYYRPDEWSGDSSRVFMVVYTSSDVYSVRMNNIANTNLYTINAYQVMNSSDLKSDSLSWSVVTDIAFINLKTGNNVVSLFDGKKITSLVPTTGITSANVDERITSFTAKYSSTINDGNSVYYHYFYTNSSNNGALVSKVSGTEYVPCDQTITVKTNDVLSSSGGSVSATGYVQNKANEASNTVEGTSLTNPFTINPTFGAEVTLVASPSSDSYEFIGWYDENDLLLNDKTTYRYHPTSSKSIVAKFNEYIPPTEYDISAVAGAGGTASVSSPTALEGSTVTFTATPDSGYAFEGWYDNAQYTGTPISSYAEYEYSVGAANTTLYAKFTQGYQQEVVICTGKAQSSQGGTITAVFDDVYQTLPYFAPSGSNAVLTATPKTHYKFEGWFSDASCTTAITSGVDGNIYSYSVGSAKTVYADFVYDPANGKNDASRQIDATALSDQAKKYYQEDVRTYITDAKVYQTFKDLADNQVNSNKDSYEAAKSNDLYTALYNIMSTTHTHGVSYPAYGPNALATYWLTTDTSSVNAKDNRNVYTMFYSDVDCYNNADMQREHIWPKSKASFYMATGLGGSDLHHLRPAYGKVNNIKSNWGFGDLHNKNGSFKKGCKSTKKVEWPTGSTSLWKATVGDETFIDVKDDVRGDVARILLYVYTRWKQPNLYSDVSDDVDDEGQVTVRRLPELDDDDSKNEGTKIIQSKEVLLKWMKEDPVSEWEMKRNDLTQDIQGNRNVFIDYPELAWLLFDESVPTNMDTPSGMNKDETNDLIKAGETTFDSETQVKLDFKANYSSSYSGSARIIATDAQGKLLKNGSIVDRGTPITYTITPDESTIYSVTINGDTATSNRMFDHPSLDGNGNYIFTKKAGWQWTGSEANVNDNVSSELDTEPIIVYLKSEASELHFRSRSLTAAGVNDGGSGSGMIAARYANIAANGENKNKVIESGDLVPNGSTVILTFTPDYGSRFVVATSQNYTAYLNENPPTRISGTDSYEVTLNVDSASSARIKTVTGKFAQTFNVRDYAEDGVDRHINNKGMRPDEDDPWGKDTDFTENFEICGVQLKTDDTEHPENKALRFISVIDEKILDKAESYGYVIGYTNKPLDSTTINRYSYNLVKDGANCKTLDCTDTENTSFGNYGLKSTETNYKYITVAVNNIQAGTNVALNTTIIARPYVVLKSKYRDGNTPSVMYGQYVDVSTGEAFCACSGSYNAILAASAS